MIYGKKNILQAKTGLAIGILKGQIIGGPVNAIKKKMGGDEGTLQGMRSYPLNWRGTAIKAVGRLTRRI